MLGEWLILVGGRPPELATRTQDQELLRQLEAQKSPGDFFEALFRRVCGDDEATVDNVAPSLDRESRPV